MAAVPSHPTDIFSILKNLDLPEGEVLNQLESVIKENPDSVFARAEFDKTPLHLAARNRSPNVCKMLIEVDTSLQTVRAIDWLYYLPFHCAVENLNLETLKYLFEVYPESINAPIVIGEYPMHLVFSGLTSFGYPRREAAEEIIQFLMKHDLGVMSIADSAGKLPLHRACGWKFTQPIVKHMFDAYPAAIHIRDTNEETPLERARRFNQSETVSFLEYQIHSVAHVSLHEALMDPDVSLGTIKLMIETNLQILREADSRGQLPVHIACGIRDDSVVKYLVGAYPDSLQICDADENLPLHIACREGKLDVINYILELSDYGVDMIGGEGMLPIHLLLLCADCDRDSVEYVDSVGRLLRLNPATLISKMVL